MSWTTTTRMTWAWIGLLGLVLLACGGESDTGRGHDHGEESEQQDEGIDSANYEEKKRAS